MKKINLVTAAICSIAFLQMHAQNDISKKISNGKITLADSSVINGFIKENIHSNASLTVITEAGGKKRTYNGNELLTAEIDSARFLCIKGDFFKVMCEGELLFLQKESDASRKPVYNGTEAFFTNGTEGKINDYFFYDKKLQQLKLVTKKNMMAVIDGSFANCTAALNKARETGDDLSQLSVAVEIYNNRNGK